MLEHHGIEKIPFITGLSVHNQRIERLWVDVKIYVICHFSNLLTYLESCSLLDSDDEINLFALHFIFLPRINLMLEELMETWNNHPLRTEKNSSPLQLWTEGDLMNSTYVNIDEFYGVDYDGRVRDIETVNNVEIPETKLDLSNEQYEYLRMNFNPLRNDSAYGVTLFQDLVSFLSSNYA